MNDNLREKMMEYVEREHPGAVGCSGQDLLHSFTTDKDGRLILWFNLPSGTTQILTEGQFKEES
jgi:hypothetical protein